ncbi:MAG: hypothetical protein KDA63_07585 [Planctomycetales bacterium]|nr:hypothetical protein [Planctomycetales bacterium]
MSEPRTITAARALAGSSAPASMAFAVLLGAVAGVWVGWNLTFAVLVTLALLVNINVRLFAVAAAATCGLGWAAAPLSHDVGRWLLDAQGLRGWMGQCTSGPVGALLGWDVYALAGATPLGAGLGMGGAAVARRWASRLPHWIVGDVCKAVAGDPSEGAGHDAAVTRMPVLRPYGVVMALALLSGWFAVTTAAVPRVIQRAVVARLERENGAEVTVGGWEYRLWSGELRCDDVRLADPERPDFDRLRIDRVTARLDAAAVLRGQLRVRELKLAGLSTGRRRLDRGRVLAASAPLFAATGDAASAAQIMPEGADDQLVVDPATAFEGWGELSNQLQHYRSMHEVLVRCTGFFQTVNDGDPAARAAIEGDTDEFVAVAQVAGRARRCCLPRLTNRDGLERIEIVGLPGSWQWGDEATVTLEPVVAAGVDDVNIGDGRWVRLSVSAPACWSLELTNDVRLESPAVPQPVRLAMRHVPAQRLGGWQMDGLRVDASQGTVDVFAEGTITSETVDVTLRAMGDELMMSAATVQGGSAQSLETQSPKTTRASVHRGAAAWRGTDGAALASAVSSSRRLNVDARCLGSWQRPRLTLSPNRLLADLDFESVRAVRQREAAQLATRGTEGFRAPDAREPETTTAIAKQQPISATGGADVTGPAPVGPMSPGRAAGAGQGVPMRRPLGIQVTQPNQGLRVEVAESTGVNVVQPSRVYVEEPRRAMISTSGEVSSTPVTDDSLGAAPARESLPQREPLPADWLKTGYDLSPTSTAAGRRWAAQQAEDRQRADQVLSQRVGATAER